MARPRKLPASQSPAELAATDDTAHPPIENEYAWISELAEALRPFAEHGRALRKSDPRGGARKEMYEGGRNSILRLGDFDRAAAVMEKLSGH